MFPTPALLRPNKLAIGGFVNIRILRDADKRAAFAANEAHRNALRYIARNTLLPLRQRTLAQLELNKMHCHTRGTQIKNRCVMGGKARGVLRDFRMGAFQFRLNATKGAIPGVKKASW
ncbi:hypothetical protein EDC01DRAFT_755872, partial [Geopyxis carbonaria]